MRIPTKNTAYWTCQILGWGGYSVIGLWVSAQQVGWNRALIIGYIVYFFYSIALTHLLRREARRKHWLIARVGQMWARLLGAACAIGAIQTFLIVGISFAQTLLTGGPGAFTAVSQVLYVFLGTTSVTMTWVVAYTVFTTTRRHQEKEAHLQLGLREAELRALEAQISPHFLFNCLNSIRGLVIENPARAQDMITRLANIMRHNLRHDVQHTVPFSSEVDAVTDYLALESVRFEDRLRVRVDIDPRALSIPVPAMLLQTLVENAVKHGIATLPEGGDLVIRAAVHGAELRIEVENSGRLGETGTDATHVGLANTRDRLQILYGDRARLALMNRDPGHVAATVLIPISV